MSVLKTAFFVKNVPPVERAIRILAAVGGAIAGLVLLAAPWSWVVAASAIGFGVTGLLGFCPACAMIGRRPA